MENISYFIENYGYIGIFLALILGIVGLPLPDELLLTFVGYNIFIGKMLWSWSVIISILGSISGITISYILGVKLGTPFLKRFGPKIGINEKKQILAEKYFSKYGSWFLIFGYFLPGIRHITAYLAGISNYGFKKFSIFAYLGAIIWVNVFISLGLGLGESWAKIETYMHDIILFIIPVCVIILLFYLIRYYVRNLTK